MASRGTRAVPGSALLRKAAWVGGTVAVLYFAVEGGEYGTSDLLTQREDVAEIEAELALLRDTVAALDSTLKLVSSDDFTLERIAREEHGLVKGPKELLYWVEDASARDSVARDSVTRDSVARDTLRDASPDSARDVLRDEAASGDAAHAPASNDAIGVDSSG